MKIITLFMALTLSLNGFAAETIKERLKIALDDYHYSATVEWDQKDQYFFEEITSQFYAKMDELHSEGMTPEDVLSLSKNYMSNNIPQGLSKETLRNWLEENKVSFYDKGANWVDSRTVFLYGVATFFIGAAIYSLWYDANYECAGWVPTGSRNTCSEWVRK